MVCETKIVADEHEAIPGTKKEAMMWGSPPSSGAALSPAEPPKDGRKDGVFIREFERGDEEEVRRIFCEGIMERIPNTAFRGIKQQPRIQFLYALLTGRRMLSVTFTVNLIDFPSNLCYKRQKSSRHAVKSAAALFHHRRLPACGRHTTKASMVHVWSRR